MAHGGKRPGAGRKALLDEEQRSWVGQQCEKLYRKAVKKAQKKTAKARFRQLGINKTLKKIRKTPLSIRKEATAFLVANKGALPEKPEDLPQSRKADKLLRRIERMREVFGDRPRSYGADDVGSHRERRPVRRTRRTRLKNAAHRGGKGEIVFQVITLTQEKYGVRISSRLVRQCWSEYREFERSLTAEDDSVNG